MSTSGLIKKLSIAAAGAAFIALETVSPAPANAITFNFEGKFDQGPQFEGSVTLDDDFLNSFVENSFYPEMPLALKAPTFPYTDPSGSYYLNVDGQTFSSSSGVTITPYVALNGPLAISGGFYTGIAQSYLLYISLNTSGSSEEGPYRGVLFFGPNVLARFPVSSSDVKSVPEPGGAIALGILGTLMLIGKRKASSSQVS